MLNHIKLKHPSDIVDTPAKAKQSSVSDYMSFPRSRRFSSSQSELITNAIVDMIVLDYMPVRMVEGKGFTKLKAIIAPEYKMASRNTVVHVLRNRIVTKKNLVSELKKLIVCL